MHLLYSTAIGTEVISDAHPVMVGRVTDLLVDPDKGVVEGLYIGSDLLPTLDIASWGHHVHVRGPELIGPGDEIVRLQALLQDARRLIGQPVCTKGGMSLGRCSDFEFNAKTFVIDWILPKKFFLFAGHPIPRSDILEVTKKEIVVKDPVKPVHVTDEQPVAFGLARRKEMDEAT